MLVLPDTKKTIYFDVDDTLVLHDRYDLPDEDGFVIVLDNYGFHLHAHTEHIERLKEHKKRGDVVVVWSQGGSEWAELVVRTLGLADFVDVVLTKPDIYYDDLMSFQFMGPPAYCRHEA